MRLRRVKSARQRNSGKEVILNLMIEMDKSAAEMEAKTLDDSASANLLEIPPFELQPGEEPRDAERYQLDELLRYHDRKFIANLYVALRKRAPTAAELAVALDELRSGRCTKIEIIESLLTAQSDGQSPIRVAGLSSPILRRVSRWPFVGYLLRMCSGFMRLPVLIKHQQEFEGYALGQQQNIADYLNEVLAPTVKRHEENAPIITDLSVTVSDTVESVLILSDSLAELSARHADFQAGLQATLERLQIEQAQQAESRLKLQADLQTLTDAMTAQDQALDKVRQTQAEAIAAQQEFLIQEENLIVEAQKVVLAEIQERLSEQLFENQQNREQSISQDRVRLSSVDETSARRVAARAGATPGNEAIDSDQLPGTDLDSLYAAFEERFRGPRDVVKEQLAVYLPLLIEAPAGTPLRPVLDVGCGRGEWLELLKEKGVHARGIDMNRVLVNQCTARGLSATTADAVDYLHTLPENSLGAVTAFHLIEHLPFRSLIELLEETRRVLRPGGLAIFETPNPKNLVVGACNFYSDPTHQRPLFPEALQFLLEYRGFAQVQVKYLHPVEASPFQQAEPGAQALDGWFYGPRDFAVIAYKRRMQNQKTCVP